MITKVVHLADLMVEVRYEPGEPIKVDTVRAVDEAGAATGPDLFGLFVNTYFLFAQDGGSMNVMDMIVDLALRDPQFEQVVLH